MAPKRKSSSRAGSTKKQSKSQETKNELLSPGKIEELSKEVITSAKHYNNLVSLIEQFELVGAKLQKEENEEIESIGRLLAVSLFKAFQGLFKEGAIIPKKSNDEKKQLVAKWLSGKYEQYKEGIRNFLKDRLAYETSLQIDVLEIYLNLIKLESEYMKSGAKDLFFANTTYLKLVQSLLESVNGEILSDGSTDNFIILEFNEFFQKNWDLQFYFVNNLNEILSEWKNVKTANELQLIFANFYTIMRNNLLFSQDSEILKDQPTWIPNKLPSIAYKAPHFRTQYQKSFITILSYPLLTSQYKSVLSILHKRIIPNLAQPATLMDFLTDSYNVEDDYAVPILALNSLYELMKKYNLEYPDFYTKLYSLLTPELLYTRYRSRFFRLCDLFLSSTHLAAQLVASFIKKLARLALTASAGGVVIVIPFVYNLLKRHPSCMVLIHNSEQSKDSDYSDPFDLNETDPLKTGAMGSSLWELETLMSHYHPNIATLAKIFSEPFRKPSYNMEDFLDWSYITLLESEKIRKYKGHAALEYQEWENIFDSKSDSPSTYLEGWTL
ncbi:CBF-domain-containing protein [Hyphopichia burtonii NRRL Y-1933]|uniref:CBF-domain-containing protein n=1 Tax=Hyphopichia burtonii NRRL Y-1933 TaxID=984485 RepID=A0A1E4RCR9_9ASCO|nr:CBF-domain-containing protein [Hyphopichia burtonii NRRL Y-1933]ODV65052.1 CBF-domain-containing protein [Hyphopichia burtonii NRRL Y-1933]